MCSGWVSVNIEPIIGQSAENVSGVAQMKHLYHHPRKQGSGTVVGKPETRGDRNEAMSSGHTRQLLQIAHRRCPYLHKIYTRSIHFSSTLGDWGGSEELLVVDGF